MKKLKLSFIFAALVAFNGNALADQYSLPAVINQITIGSTGNWYFYPTTGTNGTIDYTNLFNDGNSGTAGAPYTHIVANPAGCSSPVRYVLDSTAGNFDEVIDSLKVFGSSSYPFGVGLLVGGFQFYVSSSSCSVNSPKIVRLRYIPSIQAIPVP